ncbi:hypothetical protein I7I48_06241 [Histoplasma ohiense]|nr:hypothetical protein I7I48_06241 [Histoplasma ohiense (nom. inval.)]
MISWKGANSAKETSSTDISEIRKALLGWNSTILFPILQHTKSLDFGLNQHKPPSLPFRAHAISRAKRGAEFCILVSTEC